VRVRVRVRVRVWDRVRAHNRNKTRQKIQVIETKQHQTTLQRTKRDEDIVKMEEKGYNKNESKNKLQRSTKNRQD
jgi:hypothetical protein